MFFMIYQDNTSMQNNHPKLIFYLQQRLQGFNFYKNLSIHIFIFIAE